MLSSPDRGGRPPLICFVGMDGTGKTTQTRRLASVMRENGIDSLRVYNRFTPRLLLPHLALRRMVLLGRKGRAPNYRDYLSGKRDILRPSATARLYRKLLLLDYVLQTLWRVGRPLKRGQSVVCDRYIYDLAVDLVVGTRYPVSLVMPLVETFLRYAPKPDLIFLMDAPEELAFARKHDTPSLEYLREARAAYLDLGRRCRMNVLDSSRPVQELEQQIGSVITSHCRLSTER